MDIVSDLLMDELPNSLVDGQTHTGSLQTCKQVKHLRSLPVCLPGGLYLSLLLIICPTAYTIYP